MPAIRNITAVLTLVAALAGCGEPEPEAPPPAPPEPRTISAADGREWVRIEYDKLHDPANPMASVLQDPGEALRELPPDAGVGNNVDWMAALEQGHIAPRTNVYPETRVRVLDLDVVFEQTAGMPLVVFPHRQHTEWLDCANCHPKIFKARKGANDFGMFDILQGRYCGRCHGAVSFPLTECTRCHSRDWQGKRAN